MRQQTNEHQRDSNCFDHVFAPCNNWSSITSLVSTLCQILAHKSVTAVTKKTFPYGVMSRELGNQLAELAIFSTILWPIGIAAVAAGEGALQTCRLRFVSANRKSCINVPSLDTACALTPAG